MADRPDAYVRKDPGDIIRSGDWNELQIRAREEIRGHKHTGKEDATQIPRAGIETHAIDGSLIDPAADVTVNTLTTNTNLTVKGDLTINGKAILGDIQDLLAKIKSLDSDKINRGGDTINGLLTFKNDLQISGKLAIGVAQAQAKLDIAQAGRSGTHPASIIGLYVTGDFGDAQGVEFRHSNATQGIGFGFNTIYAAGSNPNQDLQLKPKGTGVTRILSVANIAGSLDFGAQVRQMVNLWNTNYGIGVQGATQYFRTDSNFAWYKGGIHKDGVFDAGGGAVQMVIKDGSVGIGTSNPTHLFHVLANDAVGLFESTGTQAYLRLSSNEGLGNRVELANRPGGRLTLWTAGGGDVFNITRNGNVGIGVDTPGSKLTVQANHNASRDPQSGISYGGQFAIKGNAPQIDFIDTDHPDWAIHVNSGRMYFIREPWNTDSLTLDSNGNIGVGTSSPTEAKFVVKGASNLTLAGYGYTNRNGAAATNDTFTSSYSIYADNRIACPEFNAFSDERIKNIQGRSDSITDIQTLLGIEITDFIYKDVVRKGDALHKKVIAQQLEQVFPQAISKQTDVVPDIYQQASLLDGWIILATDLKKGERVNLISDSSEGVYEVLEVTEDKFRTDLKSDGDTVFVFGREVNDFRSVDYDALTTLNVSATQQLKKEIDALQAENVLLKARLDTLETKIH
jgi:hypothetical protein